jgi:hypothetical protein
MHAVYTLDVDRKIPPIYHGISTEAAVSATKSLLNGRGGTADALPAATKPPVGRPRCHGKAPGPAQRSERVTSRSTRR